jgi:AraC family transcriptional regulator of adaptative response / DNA-3-methyladenine glycosylase II
MDDDHCYRAAESRDGRFDGTFVTAVLTTRIYCRPSCPAMTPQRRNVRFYPTPAAAQDAGFRACKRCRPDAAPGSPEWDMRADLVARAVRLIGDGIVEREGVGGLARRVGYTPRQLQRVMTAELGTGALRLAVAHRVQSARALLETTDLPVTDVALASGFGSIRQFNDRFREVFATTPSKVRAEAQQVPGTATSAQGITAHLTYRPPMDLAATLAFLGRRAVPGCESWDGITYRAVLDLPRGPGVVTVLPRAAQGRQPSVACRFELTDVRDYATAVARVRRLLDLDADPEAVANALGDDPLVGCSVRANPGRRVPGTADPWELAVRTVLAQQIPVSGARRIAARIVENLGRPAGEWRTWPTPESMAQADPADLPLPRPRALTLIGLAREVAEGRLILDVGSDRDRVERQLLALPGIGARAAAYIRMRGLGDPDVHLAGDLVVDRAAGPDSTAAGPDSTAAGPDSTATGPDSTATGPDSTATGPDSTATGPGNAAASGPERWKPWRSYAAVHLWATAVTAAEPAK